MYSLHAFFDGYDVQSEALTNERIFGQSPEKMVHSIILSNSQSQNKKLYQFIYTGDRFLNIQKMREICGDDQLHVDERFVGDWHIESHRFDRSKIIIEMPEQENDIIQIIDNSLLEKSLVHVVRENHLSGVWIDANTLVSAFKDAIITSFSDEGSIEGLDFSSNGSKALNDVEAGVIQSLKPVLHKATIKEIEFIEEDMVDDLVHIIDNDYFVYNIVLNCYFSLNSNPETAPSTIEIVNFLGTDFICSNLKGIINSKDYIESDCLKLYNNRDNYRHIGLLSHVMEQVVALLPSTLEIPKNLGKAIGRLSGQQSSMWASTIDIKKRQSFNDQFFVNRHRFMPEVQYKEAGYNQLDLAVKVMEVNNYPSLLRNSIANQNNPFYKGEGEFVARIMYIVQSLLTEKGLIGLNQFSQSVVGLHHIMIRELKLEKIIDVAFNGIEEEIKRLGKIEWRYS